ncbi:MAG TPA: oxidoreductase [Sphingomonas sp.]|nr:oxidoreductase [Sphingomonas sp.]
MPHSQTDSEPRCDGARAVSVAVGLIGYGLGGRAFHAPLIDAVARLRLAAIATSRREDAAAAWPGVQVVNDPAALIADPSIDLVVVATPNATHAALARAALEAGKHVVVDKPLAIDAAEGEALAATARAHGRMLSVFHNRRWDGDFLTVKRLLDDGALGRLALYEGRWDRFRLEQRAGWKDRPGPGSGLLPDLGSHLIDQALQLFGLPEALTADIAAQRDQGEVEDYFELTFHYGEMRAILSAATLVAAPRPRFALHGTAASFVKPGIDPQEAWMAGGRRPADPGFGEDDPDTYGTFTTPDGAARRIPTARGDYRRFYEGVVDAIVADAPPSIDPADAIAGLRLIDLARRSAAEGRRIAVT